MKSISGSLATHLAGDALTLATLWRITRIDGEVFRFTDHDRDIVYGGETYIAALGYRRAAVSSGADLSVDETEVEGLIDDESISVADLRAGLWDGATVRIFAVNWATPTQGEIKFRKGILGEVTTTDSGLFRAELRGLAQRLQQTIGSLYQAECRADLGDARCGLNLAFGGGWTAADTVASVTNSVTLVLTGTGTSALPDGWFDGGVAIWQSGDNAGVAREVIGWTQGTLTLELLGPPPVAPAPGDVLHIQAGCDKRWSTCRDKFNNRLNFRGEPLVPGAQAMLETPA